MLSYDPKNVILVFGGALIDGYADGSFIQIVYNADLFSVKIGSDGEQTRSKSNNLSARITVTLAPGSTGNAILSDHFVQNTVPGVNLWVPVSVIDRSTMTLHHGQKSWVVKEAGVDHQQEAQNKQWLIDVARLDGKHGSAVGVL